MPLFTPKKYQKSALESMERYFRLCQSMSNADYAFQEATRQLWGRKTEFTPLTGFDKAMPYFCLRIPTGGGKTFLAAKAVNQVNQHLLHAEHSVILWLVPSKAIRDQTLSALKNLDHPYHKALREAGAVTVMDLDGAKNLNRSTLETSTVVIIATAQAFRREDSDYLKAFQNSGALMPLFDHLTPAQKAFLLKDDDGNTPFSLVNALRLRRPYIIVDEAHNARTSLAFDTLAKFHPSGIMELTATPDMEKTPSNVLHTVSAVELKAEQMIKLPIQLECVPDAQKCLNYAIDQRNQLDALAQVEQAKGANYLRPLVLIQAEANSSTRETRNTEWVKRQLIEVQNISEEEIVIATGSERGLENLEKEFSGGIFSQQCPVKFIITQKALAEGWDCPFAYILVSMAELKSSTAIEQLLGRILRQPNACFYETEELNRSYSYVVSRDFSATAASLRDRLIEGAGFERREANEFVSARRQEDLPLDVARQNVTVAPVIVQIPEAPEMTNVSPAVKRKIQWNVKKQELTIKQPLSDEETEEVKAAFVMEVAKEAVVLAVEKSRESVQIFHSPAVLGEILAVPQMMVRIDGELRLFDEPEAIDHPWTLPALEAKPTMADGKMIMDADKVTDGGLIDVSDDGVLKTKFGLELERDLNLAYTPEHWNEAKLAAWFCHQIKDPSITHQSKRAFVSAWMTKLQAEGEIDLAKINRHKFLIRSIIETQVVSLRKEANAKACEQFLFDSDAVERVVVGGESGHQFLFDAVSYSPVRAYDVKVGGYDFRHHFYESIGDFDSEEERLCAEYLDQLAEKGKLKYWVRNLEGKRPGAFFLQMTDGRFHPDFICALDDGRILIVEYKGAHLWKDAEDKRRIGKLWAELSRDQCLFVMITDKGWAAIDQII